MKQLKIILSMAFAVFCFTAVNAQSTMAKAKKVKTVTAFYQYPIKCEGEKTYTKTGKCPKYNIELDKLAAKNDAQNHKGHNHN